MHTALFVLALIVDLAACAFGLDNSTNNSTTDTIAASVETDQSAVAQWQVTFEDHFDHLDLTKWQVYHECSTHHDCIHNDEKQVYLRDQVYVDNGHLVLEASNVSHYSPASGERHFRSAKLDTATSFSQRFGKFEARIRLPRGAGMWPAFWYCSVCGLLRSHGRCRFMPKGGQCWPMDGEIDIVEYVGQTPQTIYGASPMLLHT
ncbi:hypothetical protein DYB32_004195 [Aphanomyces invadans]|uniref:GH16 domain-containing protein n=1 Tax=Aphanomyces invadans TaxID=157072 RepID=A0A418AYF0_9STRA|nr:hypothetical protein DYB32_004195 [Aphanomyces invadans]